MEPKKVLVSFYDNNEDGQIDDPDAFENIVKTDTIDPETGFIGNFVYFQKLSDGLRYNLVDTTVVPIYAYPNKAELLQLIDPINGQLYYFYDFNIHTNTTAINSGQDPFSPYFDTSFVWGPTRGREIYLGLRFKLLKK
jgi:hypothetical protein